MYLVSTLRARALSIFATLLLIAFKNKTRVFVTEFAENYLSQKFGHARGSEADVEEMLRVSRSGKMPNHRSKIRVEIARPINRRLNC